MADNCMLASSDQLASHYDANFPIIAQPKLDGIRTLIIDKVAYSRNMKPLPNVAFQEMVKRLPNWTTSFVFDGEAYAHGKDFNQIQEVIMDQEDDLTTDFHFAGWDCVPAGKWSQRNYDAGYVQRWNILKNNIKRLHSTAKPIVADFFKTVDTYYIGNPFSLSILYSDILSDGYEGLILKAPMGKYKWGLSTLRRRLRYKVETNNVIRPSDHWHHRRYWQMEKRCR